MARRRPRIGLALGAGSARGWAHIGVIQGLQAQGIHPDIVAGTSIGALVGASYVTGNLDELADWVSALTWQQVVGYLDPSFSGGLIAGKKLFDFFRNHYEDRDIGELSVPFGAVATDLESGQEVWLQSGSVLQAVRASVALPGIFTPVQQGQRWLLDGGLVNPVPISLCRAMGAEIVIAVDLNADLLQRHHRLTPAAQESQPGASLKAVDEEAGSHDLRDFLRHQVISLKSSLLKAGSRIETPSLIDIVLRSINIMQTRITRSRMAGDPPELVIAPHLGDILLMEFHRANEAIREGRQSVVRVESDVQQIKKLL